MPDPIPRNRSARGRRARRPARQRAWPGQLFQRPRGNAGPPGPPPPPPPAVPEVRLGDLFRRRREAPRPPELLPPPPARQQLGLGQPFWRPRGDVAPPEPAPPQPRPPARPRVRAGQRFRRPGRRVAPPGPRRHRPPGLSRSGSNIAAGGLMVTMAVLAVWIVVPLLPSATPAGSTATPSLPGRADVPAPARTDPGPVSDQLAARPGTLAAPDRGPVAASETRPSLTAAHRSGGSPVAVGQADSAPQPVQPHIATNVADQGQRTDPSAGDHVQQRPEPPSNFRPPEQDQPETPKPKPPADSQPLKPNPQREQIEAWAHQIAAKFPQGGNDNAGSAKPATRPQRGAGGNGSNAGSQGGRPKSTSSGKAKMSSGGGGKQGRSASSGSRNSSGSGSSRGGNSPSGSSSSN